MADPVFDQARSEAFAGRMMDVLNGAGITLMSSIGHQVGLFDAMADLPPATSQQIAEAAGLNERYVREWLGVMVTGGVVDYDPDRQYLPAASRARGLAHTGRRHGQPDGYGAVRAPAGTN